jgi:AcrR family transcriptional regulator
VSLNELSRRVGLATSNVLRYFESREAILLELLDAELREWIVWLSRSPVPTTGTARERGSLLAEALADSMSTRPVMCDLISAQTVQILVAHITRVLPELRPDDAYEIVVVTILMASGAWPSSQPSEALRAAYDADPAVAAGQLKFADVVRRTVELAIAGLLLERNALPTEN